MLVIPIWLKGHGIRNKWLDYFYMKKFLHGSRLISPKMGFLFGCWEKKNVIREEIKHGFCLFFLFIFFVDWIFREMGNFSLLDWWGNRSTNERVELFLWLSFYAQEKLTGFEKVLYWGTRDLDSYCWKNVSFFSFVLMEILCGFKVFS